MSLRENTISHLLKILTAWHIILNVLVLDYFFFFSFYFIYNNKTKTPYFKCMIKNTKHLFLNNRGSMFFGILNCVCLVKEN